MAKLKLQKSVLKCKKTLKPNNKVSYRLMFFKKFNKTEKHDEKKLQEKKMKKSTWIFLLCNVVIIGAILTYTLLTQEVKPIGELFKENPYYRFFSIALVAMLLVYIVEGLCYSILFKKTTGRFSFWMGIKVAIVGKYWDNITPFGSGGQFAQVAYIKGKKYSGDVSTSVIVGKYLLFQIAFLLLGVIAIIVPFDLFQGGQVIKYLAIAGVIINILLFAFTLLVSISRKACSVLVVGGIKLLTKMRIIKNYRKAIMKSMNFIQEYQKSMKAFAKNPLIIISEVLLNVISLILVSSVAYFIYLIFNPYGTVNGIKIMIMSFLCTFASSIVPIPGGSGAAEVSFVAMFSTLFTEGTTFWALMFWRLLTYYLYLLIGFLFTIIEPFCVRRRANKITNNQENVEDVTVIDDNNDKVVDNIDSLDNKNSTD